MRNSAPYYQGLVMRLGRTFGTDREYDTFKSFEFVNEQSILRHDKNKNGLCKPSLCTFCTMVCGTPSDVHP